MKKHIVFKASKSVETISQELESNSQNSSIYIKLKLVKEKQKEFIDLLVDHLKNNQHYVDISIHISKYVLISNQGYEKIAQSLIQLTNIQILSLNFENNCQIEPEVIMHFTNCIKNLYQLQSLSIIISGYNYILNKGFERISSCLPLLTNLKRLTIQIKHQNRYDQQGILLFCQNLKLLSQLIFLELQLDGAEIYQDGIKALATALKNLQNLQSLNLQIDFSNQLFDGVLDLALEQLANLKDLKFVVIQHNRIKPTFEINLSSILRQLKQLESLHIEGILYFIDEQSIDSFTDKFNNIPVLKKLVLKLDHLKKNSQQVMQSIFKSLKIFQNLDDLQLMIQSDFINGAEDLSDLALAIKGMKNLINLDIYFYISQEIVFKGIECVGEALGELKQLKCLILTLRNNSQISQEGGQAIGEGIKKLVNLVKLEINIHSKNQISQNGIFSLGQSLFQIKDLRELNYDLSERIANQGILGFAEGFKGLNNLQKLTLCLQFSHFYQENKKQFFESFKYLTNLQKLEIRPPSYCSRQETNNINLSDLSLVFSYLQNLTNLKIILILEEQHIQNYIDFQKALSSLTKLIYLDLKINGKSFDQQFCQSLLKGVQNLNQIETLKINFGNGMNLNSSKLFIEAFKNKINLKNLYLNLQIADLDILNNLGESFSHLYNLKKIDLFVNSFLGKISNGICDDSFGNGLGSLKNLRDINLILYINSLPNQNYQSILKGIKSLKNLENVCTYLIDNSKLVFEILDVVTSLENLQSFKFLNSYKVFQIKEKQQISMSDQHEIQNKLENGEQKYSCLSSLSINVGQNEDNDYKKLEYFLQNFKNINQLLLDYKSLFSINQSILLSNSLKNLQKLNDLTLKFPSNCSFETLSAKFLGNALKSLSYLENLTLEIGDSNQINEEGAHYLAEGIRQMNYLRQLKLNIQNCNIQKQGAIQIGNSLAQLTQLRLLFLEIGENQIGQEGATSIGRALKNLINLSELNIQIGNSNRIQQGGAYEIGLGIQNLVNLLSLNLSIKKSNYIQSSGISGICEAINQMQELNDLNLNFDENEIESESIRELSKTIQLQKYLTQFKIKFHLSKISQDYFFEAGHLLSLVDNSKIFFLFYEDKDLINIEISSSNQISFQKQIHMEISNQENISAHTFLIIESLNLLNKINSLEIKIRGFHQHFNIGPKLLNSLQKLQFIENLKIIFDQSQFNIGGINEIGEAISKLTNLKYLDLGLLSQNNISHQSLSLLGSNISQLKNLESIKFVIVCQYGLQFSDLVDFIRNFVVLQQLRLVQIKQNLKFLKESKYLIQNELARKIKRLVIFKFFSNSQEL